MPQPTLSRWLREATTLRKKMAKRQDDEEQKLVAAEVPQRTAEEKFSLVSRLLPFDRGLVPP